MTIKQAIEELQQYPPDAKLYIDIGDTYEAMIGTNEGPTKDGNAYVRAQWHSYDPPIYRGKVELSITKWWEE